MSKRKAPKPPSRKRKTPPVAPTRKVAGASIQSVLRGKDAWHIVLGNVLANLQLLPDNSIHHVTTSPPYWSLRDYGVPATIWGGDADCEHEWSDELGKVVNTPSKPIGAPESRREETESLHKMHLAASRGYFCNKCGAWRGALGLEPDPNLFVYHLILIFREVHRALHPAGTMLLNLGDSFFGNSPIRKSRRGSEGEAFPGGKGAKDWNLRQPSSHILDLKPKDRVMLPHRVAMAMQKPWMKCTNCGNVEHGMWWGDLGMGRFVCPNCCKLLRNPKIVEKGWYIRMDNVWDKPMHMPDPTTDRPTCSHEYVFLCAKSKKYYWDGDAVREPSRSGEIANADDDSVYEGRNLRSVWRINPNQASWDFCLGCDTFFDKKARRKIKKSRLYNKKKDSEVVVRKCPVCGSFDDWVDHFAMFPSDLPEIGVRAGTSPSGCCAECRTPYRPVTSYDNPNATKGRGKKNKAYWEHHGGIISSQVTMRPPQGEAAYQDKGVKRLLGYEKACKCSTKKTVPCVVVDIFNGGGTTGLTAKRYLRSYIGFDLNPSFVKLTRHRMRLDFPLGRFLSASGPGGPVGPPKPGGA